MTDRQKSNLSFGLGIVAGAAIGLWLNSDKGREVRSEAQRQAIDYGNQANEYINDTSRVVSEKANEYYNQARQNVEATANKAVNTYNQGIDTAANYAENAIEGSERTIKEGISKTKDALMSNSSLS